MVAGDATETSYWHDVIWWDSGRQPICNSTCHTKFKEAKTNIEIKVKPKKESHNEKTETKEKAELEVQQEKTLIITQKEQNQCGSTNIYNSNVYF